MLRTEGIANTYYKCNENFYDDVSEFEINVEGLPS